MAFDHWLRHEFVDLNTELEEAHFAARAEVLSSADLDAVKRTIAADGAKLIAQCVVPADPVERYQLLGAVGFYLAACARHQVEVPEPAVVGSLANPLGSSLGVAPRFVFSHQCLYGFRTFTALDDERVLVTQNRLGVLAYQRAADALRRTRRWASFRHQSRAAGADLTCHQDHTPDTVASRRSESGYQPLGRRLPRRELGRAAAAVDQRVANAASRSNRSAMTHRTSCSPPGSLISITPR